MKDIVFELSAKPVGTFTERLDELHGQFTNKLAELRVGQDGLMWTRLFLSDAANQLPGVLQHPFYKEVLSQAAFSYIEQSPLSGSKVALMAGITPDEVQREGTPDRFILKHNGKRFLFHSVRFTAEEAVAMDAKQQTKEAFARHIAWLTAEGLTLKDHCVRTWLFVRDIDRNYHDVVVGRNEVFALYGLTPQTHFIASTGIAGNGANGNEVLCADFWSVDDPDMEVHYLQALDYLNPTHQYGVAFERGTAFVSAGVKRLLISGTASIDKEGRCLYEGDVLRQAERLFCNIEHLLADGGATLADVAFLYVYLRDLSDYAAVSRFLDERFPGLPRQVVLAPVCRPQWLIEAECIAYQSV